ncbi:MAG TPA: TIGR04053 family radical SAM/SPASM domain-containing protein [Candidatus Binataceae bacterium]|nr:TIGR04053 family radical SAM/SPASM domain-containing protein [Candidatus Binataceae bacterium]
MASPFSTLDSLSLERAANRTIRHARVDLSHRPFIVIWEVTRACDLACLHCRATSMATADPAELSTADGLELIDQIAAFGSPPPLFVLTGGDPLKRRDLVELVRHAASRGLPTALSPSATPLLTTQALAELKDAGLVAISLSLDGSSAPIHDSFRGREQTFARTLEAWERAHEIGLKVQVNTTVTRRNLRDLAAIARLVLEHRAMTWSVFFLVQTGRGSGLEQILPTECEDVLNFLYDVGAIFPVKTTEAHHFKRVAMQRAIIEQTGSAADRAFEPGENYRYLRREFGPIVPTGRRRRPPLDINAARGFVFVSHTGEVYPSGFLPLSAGNVRTTELPSLYRTSAIFTALRETRLLEGRCGACEFAPVCGGSRSRAFAQTGDLLAEDALCGYEPGSFPYQAELAALLVPMLKDRGHSGDERDPATAV